MEGDINKIMRLDDFCRLFVQLILGLLIYTASLLATAGGVDSTGGGDGILFRLFDLSRQAAKGLKNERERLFQEDHPEHLKLLRERKELLLTRLNSVEFEYLNPRSFRRAKSCGEKFLDQRSYSQEALSFDWLKFNCRSKSIRIQIHREKASHIFSHEIFKEQFLYQMNGLHRRLDPILFLLLHEQTNESLETESQLFQLAKILSRRLVSPMGYDKGLIHLETGLYMIQRYLRTKRALTTYHSQILALINGEKDCVFSGLSVSNDNKFTPMIRCRHQLANSVRDDLYEIFDLSLFRISNRVYLHSAMDELLQRPYCQNGNPVVCESYRLSSYMLKALQPAIKESNMQFGIFMRDNWSEFRGLYHLDLEIPEKIDARNIELVHYYLPAEFLPIQENFILDKGRLDRLELSRQAAQYALQKVEPGALDAFIEELPISSALRERVVQFHTTNASRLINELNSEIKMRPRTKLSIEGNRHHRRYRTGFTPGATIETIRRSDIRDAEAFEEMIAALIHESGHHLGHQYSEQLLDIYSYSLTSYFTANHQDWLVSNITEPYYEKLHQQLLSVIETIKSDAAYH